MSAAILEAWDMMRRRMEPTIERSSLTEDQVEVMRGFYILGAAAWNVLLCNAENDEEIKQMTADLQGLLMGIVMIDVTSGRVM